MSQASFRELRMGGQHDRPSPWMQSMALACREASKELSQTGKPNVAWVARKVKRVGGKHPVVENKNGPFVAHVRYQHMT